MSAPCSQQQRRSFARLSSRVTPAAGTAISADAPPESRTSSVSPAPSTARERQAPGGPPARSRPSAPDDFAATSSKRRASARASGAMIEPAAHPRTEPALRRPRPSPRAALPTATSQTRCDRCRSLGDRRRSARSTSAPGSTARKRGADDRPGDRVGAWASGRVSACASGSDQAESPVTTSNFLRRELTTSSALSLRAELLELRP